MLLFALTSDPIPVDGFEEFWTCYPRHKAKADAEKAWKKLKPSAALRQTILAAIAAQKAERARS